MTTRQGWQSNDGSKNGAVASHIHAVSATVVPPKPQAIVIATQKEYEPVNPVGLHVSSSSVSQHTSSPCNQENKQGTSNLVTFLRGKGLTVINKRASGGASGLLGDQKFFL